ncbi:MAG: DNA translocase FtsK, partial [Alphaproteobacteria bacterium]
ASAIDLSAKPKPRRRARETDASEEEIADSSADRAVSLVIGGLLHLVMSSAALVRRLLRWLYRLATGKGGEEQQSRLKIAMARAGENTVVWSDEIGDDDLGEEADYLPMPDDRRPWFGARLMQRLWGDEPPELEAHDNHGPRVEPSFFASQDLDGMEPEALDFAENPDAAPLPAGPMGAAPQATDKVAKKPSRKPRNRATRKSGQPFQLPPLSLLNRASATANGAKMSREELAANAHQLESVLDDFGIRGEIVNVWPGPIVTLYELEPAPGIKSSRVIGLADDIARSMSAISARISVVPGRNVIGIELPNQTREMVSFYDLIAAKEYIESPQKLAISLGKNIGGEPVITDLARMPHLLVAGTTGSGKSVGINAMILSLLFRMTPEQCKLIMIDPKMLELSVYDGIPHLLSPVVTDPRKAVVALKWAVREMEDRYKNMSKLGVRNIDGYNARVREAAAKGEVLSRTVQTGFGRETGQPIYETEELNLEPLPYIVVVVDEMADLMMVAGKDIEGAIQRLAQMARAAGLHLIMATQRPSVDVITGTIKANFPTRISFQVTSKIDSRTILGEQGAEQLLGQGDMLYMAGGGRITRVHGAFVSDGEVESVVQFLKRQGVPEYLEAVTQELATDAPDSAGPIAAGEVSQADLLYDQAVAVVARDRKASTSYIQRRLSIGYNRAATIIERMENEGVVSPANHAGKREVLLPKTENDTI